MDYSRSRGSTAQGFSINTGIKTRKDIFYAALTVLRFPDEYLTTELFSCSPKTPKSIRVLSEIEEYYF